MIILVVTSLLPALIVTGKEDKKEKADYPLDVCVVSGAKLGSMGEPYEYKHDGRRILLCCAGCVRAIENNPEKYLKKLDEAAKEAAKKAVNEAGEEAGEDAGKKGHPKQAGSCCAH